MCCNCQYSHRYFHTGRVHRVHQYSHLERKSPGLPGFRWKPVWILVLEMTWTTILNSNHRQMPAPSCHAQRALPPSHSPAARQQGQSPPRVRAGPCAGARAMAHGHGGSRIAVSKADQGAVSSAASGPRNGNSVFAGGMFRQTELQAQGHSSSHISTNERRSSQVQPAIKNKSHLPDKCVIYCSGVMSLNAAW